MKSCILLFPVTLTSIICGAITDANIGPKRLIIAFLGESDNNKERLFNDEKYQKTGRLGREYQTIKRLGVDVIQPTSEKCNCSNIATSHPSESLPKSTPNKAIIPNLHSEYTQPLIIQDYQILPIEKNSFDGLSGSSPDYTIDPVDRPPSIPTEHSPYSEYSDYSNLHNEQNSKTHTEVLSGIGYKPTTEHYYMIGNKALTSVLKKCNFKPRDVPRLYRMGSMDTYTRLGGLFGTIGSGFNKGLNALANFGGKIKGGIQGSSGKKRGKTQKHGSKKLSKDSEIGINLAAQEGVGSGMNIGGKGSANSYLNLAPQTAEGGVFKGGQSNVAPGLNIGMQSSEEGGLTNAEHGDFNMDERGTAKYNFDFANKGITNGLAIGEDSSEVEDPNVGVHDSAGGGLYFAGQNSAGSDINISGESSASSKLILAEQGNKNYDHFTGAQHNRGPAFVGGVLDKIEAAQGGSDKDILNLVSQAIANLQGYASEPNAEVNVNAETQLVAHSNAGSSFNFNGIGSANNNFGLTAQNNAAGGHFANGNVNPDEGLNIEVPGSAGEGLSLITSSGEDDFSFGGDDDTSSNLATQGEEPTDDGQDSEELGGDGSGVIGGAGAGSFSLAVQNSAGNGINLGGKDSSSSNFNIETEADGKYFTGGQGTAVQGDGGSGFSIGAQSMANLAPQGITSGFFTDKQSNGLSTGEGFHYSQHEIDGNGFNFGEEDGAISKLDLISEGNLIPNAHAKGGGGHNIGVLGDGGGGLNLISHEDIAALNIAAEGGDKSGYNTGSQDIKAIFNRIAQVIASVLFAKWQAKGHNIGVQGKPEGGFHYGTHDSAGNVIKYEGDGSASNTFHLPTQNNQGSVLFAGGQDNELGGFDVPSDGAGGFNFGGHSSTSNNLHLAGQGNAAGKILVGGHNNREKNNPGENIMIAASSGVGGGLNLGGHNIAKGVFNLGTQGTSNANEEGGFTIKAKQGSGGENFNYEAQGNGLNGGGWGNIGGILDTLGTGKIGAMLNSGGYTKLGGSAGISAKGDIGAKGNKGKNDPRGGIDIDKSSRLKAKWLDKIKKGLNKLSSDGFRNFAGSADISGKTRISQDSHFGTRGIPRNWYWQRY